MGFVRMEKTIHERMQLNGQDQEKVSPASLINARQVISAMREFFGSSPLSQFMDQNNLLTSAACPLWVRAVCPGTEPDSRSATYTTPTTEECVLLRPLKVLTSV